MTAPTLLYIYVEDLWASVTFVLALCTRMWVSFKFVMLRADKSAIKLENNCDILACNFPSHIEQKDKENICNYHVLLYIQLLYLVYVYPLIGR